MRFSNDAMSWEKTGRAKARSRNRRSLCSFIETWASRKNSLTAWDEGVRSRDRQEAGFNVYDWPIQALGAALPQRKTAKKTALIVDDDSTLRYVLARLARLAGWEILEANMAKV